MGDGDGWVQCTGGHRHWGRFGAAGLLLVDDGRVVLQHRSPNTHEGGTWALPGGARDSGEDPVQTALREAGEEAGIAADTVEPLAWSCVPHDDWSYTTVIARPVGPIEPFAANWESDDVRWWPVAAVDGLALHSGFAAAWRQVRLDGLPLRVVVDAANVVGSRPDGWWRDRAAAAGRLHRALLGWARIGVAAADLPDPLRLEASLRVLPHITMVVEGAARSWEIGGAGADTEWWWRAVRVVAAPASGDDAVVAAAEDARRRSPAHASVLVITADRGLRDRLPDGVAVTGPGWLWHQLDAAGRAAPSPHHARSVPG